MYIITILSIYSLQAQDTVMNIGQMSEIWQRDGNLAKMPQGITQIKDVNGVFDPYIGTWTTQVDDKIITFCVSKEIRRFIRSSTLEAMILSYKVEDLNGNLIFDSRLMPAGTYSGMWGKYFRASGRYLGSWNYRDIPNSKCGSTGYFTLKYLEHKLQPDQLEFSYTTGYDMGHRSCTDGYQRPPLPNDRILYLTKQ